MTIIDVVIVPFGDEQTFACSCCGRPIYAGAGDIRSAEGGIADYWYRWSEGHQGLFHLAVHLRGTDGEPVEDGGVIVLSGQVDAENIVYSVVEPERSPWADFGAYGAAIGRSQALENAGTTGLFDIVDSIAANEHRISSRILSGWLKA